MLAAPRNRLVDSHFYASLLVMAVACAAAIPAQADVLVRHEQATPLGLERAWFAQARVDLSRNRIRHWTLYNDYLVALSSGGTVHAIDAHTGETRWVTQVGASHHDATGPALNNHHVAVLSGSRLFLLDRENGSLLWSRTVGSAPAAAPALGRDYAFVGLFDGRIEGYPLDDPSGRAWYLQSIGRIFQKPTATGQVLSWSTDQGYLYIGEAEPPRISFRIETSAEITAPPADAAPYLYVATRTGYVYCIHERSGSERWQYSTGEMVLSQPAVVDQRLYVASEEPALHAVDIENGERLWAVQGISTFAAQGQNNIYGVDDVGTFYVVNREDGHLVGSINLDSSTRAIVNDQSDRIYLVNDRGLVQCLHESELTEPIRYREERPTAEPTDAEAEATEEPAEEVAPEIPQETEETPFPEDEPDDGNPFGDFNPFGS